MAIGSLHIQVALAALILIIGVRQRTTSSTSLCTCKRIAAIVILFSTYVGGLLPAFLHSLFEYEYSWFRLIAVGHVPLWLLFFNYIRQNVVNPVGDDVFPSLLGAAFGLGLLHHMNAAYLTYLEIHPLSDALQILIMGAIYHVCFLIGIGITKALTPADSGIPWSFVFVFVFGLIVLINLQIPDISIAQNTVLSIVHILYGIVVTALLNIACDGKPAIAVPSSAAAVFLPIGMMERFSGLFMKILY